MKNWWAVLWWNWEREGAQKIKVPNAKIQLNSKGTDHRALRGFTNSSISASTAEIQLILYHMYAVLKAYYRFEILLIKVHTTSYQRVNRK